LTLAACACRPESSRGRVVPEPAGPLRGPYQRDRDRIVHATAFRRLEYKTQVLVNFEGDHFRTRLTHTLEVAQVARTLARALAVDEDLAEAVALAHDLGHSPFGHAGERALDTALAAFGGFDHNVQTFRIVTRLERRYAAFDGLNLTAETLEGVVKHNGPVERLPAAIADHPAAGLIEPGLEAPIEAQAAAIADDVAYCNHDLDDGLRAGFFALDELARLPLVDGILAEVDALRAGLEPERRAHELSRRLIDRMVADLVAESRRRIARAAPADPAAVRRAGGRLVGFSASVAAGVDALRAFLHDRMYRHYRVNRMSLKAQRLVNDLATTFLDAPDCLPDGWRGRAAAPRTARTAAAVRDYIAGMTDRYALDEHDRLFKMSRERA
jgi:dGTPase